MSVGQGGAVVKYFVVLVSAAALLLDPLAVRADEVSETTKIEELFQLTHVDRMTTQMLDQIKTMLTAQVAKIDASPEAREGALDLQKKMLTLITDRLSWAKAKPAYLKIYSETFTEADIDGMLAFYKSPAGHSMLEKMPELMKKSMAFGQALMADITPEIDRMIKEMKEKAAK